MRQFFLDLITQWTSVQNRRESGLLSRPREVENAKFLGYGCTTVQMARLKRSPEEREAMAAFGDALLNARLRNCSRLFIVTPEHISAYLGITANAYYKYEQGVRKPTREHLAELCGFYGHDKETQDELKRAYDDAFGKKIEKEPALLRVARIRPLSFLDEVNRLSLASNRLYEGGRVREAYEMANTAWCVAISSSVSGKPTYLLSLVLSRFLSQLGQNREAVNILETACARAAADEEPAMHCSLELSLAACRLRLSGETGFTAAHGFSKVVHLIRRKQGTDSPAENTEWMWLWCDAHRSRIISLTTGLEESHGEYLNLLLPDFCRLTHEVGSLARTRSNTLARVEAAVGDPDNAMFLIASLDSPANLFADQAFHAQSKIIASFRQGRVADAVDEARVWAGLCRERDLLNKRTNFKRLEARMMLLAERKLDRR